MASETNQDRAIGRLEGKVDGLIAFVERSEKTATENRSKVYERLETNAASTAEIARTLKHIDGRLAAAEAAAKEAKDAAAEANGKVDKINVFYAKLAAAGTGLGVGFGMTIDTIKGWFFGPPHG